MLDCETSHLVCDSRRFHWLWMVASSTGKSLCNDNIGKVENQHISDDKMKTPSMSHEDNFSDVDTPLIITSGPPTFHAPPN